MTGGRTEGHDPVDVELLLWRLADEYAPLLPEHSHTTRPTWFDHAGDLVVAGGPVCWETPWRTDGGFEHGLPAGKHPVYVGTVARTRDDRDPEAFRYYATMLVIPLADPARIAAAELDVDGYDDVHEVEDYAVLWGEEAMRETLPHEDGVPSFFPAARDRILAKGPHFRRDNWAEVVLDQGTGLNGFVFPVSTESLTGYEIVDDEDNLLCLVLATRDC